MPTTPSPEKQLAGFIAKFSPTVAREIRAARRRMRSLLPRAVELVYDNYNFMVIGYGTTLRQSDIICSLASQARGVTLFFLYGVGLPDPERLLVGSGKQVRGIQLQSAADLDRPAVRALIRAAVQRAKTPSPSDAKHALVIRLISKKQRPRRN